MHRTTRVLLTFTFALTTVFSGYINAASTLIQVNVEWIDTAELKQKIDGRDSPVIIDVRSSESYGDSESKIRGAIHVRLRRLRSRLSMPPLKDIPRDKDVVTYCACANDEASIHAAQLLTSFGFKRVRVLKGGWNAWLKEKGQLEAKSKL